MNSPALKPIPSLSASAVKQQQNKPVTFPAFNHDEPAICFNSSHIQRVIQHVFKETSQSIILGLVSSYTTTNPGTLEPENLVAK